MNSAMRLGLLVAAASLLCAACGEESLPTEEPDGVVSHAAVDYISFPSLTELARASNSVVEGRIEGVKLRGLDTGGLGEGHETPMIFYSFSISKNVAGPSLPDQIIVGWLDSAAAGDTELSDISASKELVLYLDSITREEAPGMPGDLSQVYIPVSGDNGVLDIVGSSASARSPVLISVTPEDGQTDPSGFVVSLQLLEANAKSNIPES